MLFSDTLQISTLFLMSKIITQYPIIEN